MTSLLYGWLDCLAWLSSEWFHWTSEKSKTEVNTTSLKRTLHPPHPPHPSSPLPWQKKKSSGDQVVAEAPKLVSDKTRFHSFSLSHMTSDVWLRGCNAHGMKTGTWLYLKIIIIIFFNAQHSYRQLMHCGLHVARLLGILRSWSVLLYTFLAHLYYQFLF